MTERSKRANIRDVAAAAGVSVTTVSHVLNGKGRIDPSTAERVQSIARQLDYRASTMARGLRGGRVGRIAVLHSQDSLGNSSLTDLAFFVRMLSAITEYSATQGFSTLLAVPPKTHTGRFDVDGVIFVDPMPGNQLLENLRQSGVPIVTTGRDLSLLPTQGNWVDNNLPQATGEMLDLFASRGAQRIALFASSPLVSYNHDSIESYRAWVRRHNRPEIIHRVGDALRESEGFFLARTVLAFGDRPDAIHCSTDRHAAGVLLAAHASEIRVPEDLMVSAGTDSIAAASTTPGLTALDLNPELMGQRACEMLISIMDTHSQKPGELIPHALIERGSVPALATAKV